MRTRLDRIDVVLWGAAILCGAVTLWLSLVSVPPGTTAFGGADKVEHAAAYLVTTLLVLLAAVWLYMALGFAGPEALWAARCEFGTVVVVVLGITLIAYTPLAGGLLTGKYSAQHRAGGFFRRILPQFSRKGLESIQPVLALLRQIGEKYSKTPSQVALRWLIENAILLPIPGAKNGKQAADNAGALSFQLTPAEIEALNQATLAWRK